MTRPVTAAQLEPILVDSWTVKKRQSVANNRDLHRRCVHHVGQRGPHASDGHAVHERSVP